MGSLWRVLRYGFLGRFYQGVGWTDTDKHGRTRTSMDEHGQARTNTDKHGRTRTSTDEPERPGEGVWYFARPCSLCTSIESRRAHPGEATASPPRLLGTPSPSSALPVHAKLGFGGSERGAELGLGVPGGQPALFPRAFSPRFLPALSPRAFSPALFPLDNHPAWEQPSGEC